MNIVNLLGMMVCFSWGLKLPIWGGIHRRSRALANRRRILLCWHGCLVAKKIDLSQMNEPPYLDVGRVFYQWGKWLTRSAEYHGLMVNLSHWKSCQHFPRDMLKLIRNLVVKMWWPHDHFKPTIQCYETTISPSGVVHSWDFFGALLSYPCSVLCDVRLYLVPCKLRLGVLPTQASRGPVASASLSICRKGTGWGRISTYFHMF